MAESSTQPYATREDVAQLETRLVDRIGQLETRLVDRISQVETRMVERTGQMQASLIKWVATFLIGHLLAGITLTALLIKLIKP
jgi:hypothetical protein